MPCDRTRPNRQKYMYVGILNGESDIGANITVLLFTNLTGEESYSVKTVTRRTRYTFHRTTLIYFIETYIRFDYYTYFL